jgi:hypothetical protein
VGAAQHNLNNVMAELDARIAELQQNLLRVPPTPDNQDCIRRMNESLAHAQNGKKILFDSCCISQICNFHWQDSSQA